MGGYKGAPQSHTCKVPPTHTHKSLGTSCTICSRYFGQDATPHKVDMHSIPQCRVKEGIPHCVPSGDMVDPRGEGSSPCPITNRIDVKT